MKKGIIFDMDGTLWDSAANVAISWEQSVKECGYGEVRITEADMQSVMGKTMDDIADILFPFAKGEKKKELLKYCGEKENEYLSEHGGILYPQIRETMEALKTMGYNLYIVSNCQSGYIEAFLEYYQFHDLIEDIECYGNNELVKGENIALVVKRNQLDKAVYVGDIQGDYDSSCQAGIPFIHAAYGFGTICAQVPKIESFSQLTEVVPTVI